MTLKFTHLAAWTLLVAIAAISPVNAADKAAGQDKPVATVNSIKLEDVRNFEIPPYDKVKTNLENRLHQTALQETVKTLRANAKIN